MEPQNEETVDQRKLLIRENYFDRHKTLTIIGFPNRSQNFRANNPSDVLTQSICVLHRNAFSLTGLEKEVELMNLSLWIYVSTELSCEREGWSME